MASAVLLACGGTAPADSAGAGQTIQVSVSPSTVSVQPGGVLTFVATVVGTAQGDVTWSVREGSAGGSVTTGGVYTAPTTEGSYQVVATSVADPTASGTATVTVTAAAALAVSPSQATVSPGATIQFTADQPATWSIEEGAAGGTITSAGLYTAPATPGTFTVVATGLDSQSVTTAAASTKARGKSKVTVTTAVAVAVSPSTASVVTPGTLTLTATVTNTTNTAVTWSVAEGATGGTVTSGGVYTAPGATGTYHVVATSVADTRASATSTITVSAAPAPTPSIAVTVNPATASLTTGGTATFSATVTNTTNTAVTWSVQEGASGGSVTSAGVYTAPSTAGTYHVVATSAADGTAKGTATVTVNAPAVTVAVNPASASLTSGGTATFAATVTNTTNTAVTWSVQEGSAGGSVTSGGVYTAPATAGTYHVVATSQADTTKKASSTVTVTEPTPAPVVTIAVPPTSATVTPACPRQFGCSVTGSTNTACTWSVQEGSSGGTVTTGGLYTAPATAGTYHVVATSQADTSKTSSATVTVAATTPPPAGPSGAHPRLFMSSADLAAYSARASVSGAAAKALIDNCANTGVPSNGAALDQYTPWPDLAVACAFAYRVTGIDAYRAKAITVWQGTLDSGASWGDGAGCTTANLAAESSWRTTWDGYSTRPRILQAVLGDTGYPMRHWPGKIALTYDWLYGATGVTDTLRSQTRSCVTAWVDNYRIRGYHNTAPASNYHAGYVAGKVMAAVAFNGDGNNSFYDDADGHLWTESLSEVFTRDLVGEGLSASPIGPMVGGDWGTWQYGPMSVLEYAVATRAIEDGGAAQPQLDRWASGMLLRQYHATLPPFTGYEDYGTADVGDQSNFHHRVSASQLNAILVANTSDQDAARAIYLKSLFNVTNGSVWDAIAERRSVAASDYRASSPPLWYVAPGTGALFARTDWTPGAFWARLAAPPVLAAAEPDHNHGAASSFQFVRGSDALVVEPANYGEGASRETNAMWVEASVFTPPSMYNGGQTPWGKSNLAWSRAATDRTYGARADLLRAFDNNGGAKPADLSFAQREWVFLPEGEIVTVDRSRLGNATNGMGVQFHTNTRAGGGLTLSNGAYVGTVGGSKVAIHPVYVSSGTPAVTQPTVGGCSASICNGNYLNCSYCDSVRIAVDRYSVKPTGTWNVAIHVIDGYASSGSPATTSRLDSSTDAYNSGVIGAAVLQGGQQSYVVASSATDGAPSATMTYRTPGGSAARHVVFDAPEDASGRSVVTASPSSGSCVVTITAGAGLTGRPLMFSVGSAATGCTVTELANAPPGAVQ